MSVPSSSSFPGGLPQLAARFNAWFSARSLGVLLALVAMNVGFPRPGLWLRGLSLFRVPGTSWAYDFPTLALTLMMLASSAHCRWTDFGELTRRRRAGGVSLLVVYALTPAVALVAGSSALGMSWGSAALQLRLGLFFVALMPIALTSAPWVRAAAGNVAFTVALIALTAALSVVTVPLYMHLAVWSGGAVGAIPLGPILKQLVLSVTLPLVAGMALRHFQPERAERWLPVLSLLSNLGLLAALSSNVAGAAGQLLANLGVLGVASLLTLGVNAAFFGVALLCARSLRRTRPGLPHEDAVALVLGGGMRSTGTAMVLGLASFPGMPLVTLPAAFFSISQQVLASLLVRGLRRGTPLLRPPTGHSLAALGGHLERRVRRTTGRYVVLAFRAPHVGSASLARVQDCVRSYDFVSRLNEGEFAVVLDEVSEERALPVARRILSRLERACPGAQVWCGLVPSSQEMAPATMLRAVCDALRSAGPIEPQVQPLESLSA